MAKLDRNPTRYKRFSSNGVSVTADQEQELAGCYATSPSGRIEWLVPSELGDYPTKIVRMEVSGFFFPVAGDATLSGEVCWQHRNDGDAVIDLSAEDDVEEALKIGLSEMGGISKPIWKVFYAKESGIRGLKFAAHQVVLAEDEELSLVMRPDQTDTSIALYLRAFVKARRY